MRSHLMSSFAPKRSLSQFCVEELGPGHNVLPPMITSFMARTTFFVSYNIITLRLAKEGLPREW